MRALRCILCLNVLQFSLEFYVGGGPGQSEGIRTHDAITREGVIQALTNYILINKLARNSSANADLTDYFKNDTQNLHKLVDAVRSVIRAVGDTQGENNNHSHVHCHGEEIKRAHSHVIDHRDTLKYVLTDLQEMRRRIGECLYTIQSFYSNTNWVEMYGETPYLDFGVNGTTLMQVAAYSEDTCKDMPDIQSNCKENIIVRDKLTSGYNHARAGIKKPSRPSGATAGKCSHGGFYDDSRKFVAKCGINKETPIEQYSPHYHLHFQASKAAVAATEHFLVGKDTSVLYQLGSDVFDSLFHVKVKQEVSLAFVMDNSGSMLEEMSAVKETVIQLVTSTAGSENEPVDYVLSLFNDPVELNNVFHFKDGDSMISQLDNVTIGGGGDCPEFAADGILKAVQLSREGSTLYVFTDADAKDENRRQEVTSAAIAKNIRITTMLTGQCSRKRRSDHYRHRRSAVEFFQHLAVATGGAVYNSTKENIRTIVAAVIEEAFPTAEIIIDTFKWPSLSEDSRQFVVDSSISNVKITVGGIDSFGNIKLIYANGSKYARMYSSEKGIIMSLQKPPPGIYTIRRQTSTELQINITAQSIIQAVYHVLDMIEKDSFVTLKGNLIVGKKYRYVFDVFGQNENGTCSDVIATDVVGHLLSTHKVSQTVTSLSMQCITDIITPDQVFQLKINGTDMNGHSYWRTMSTVFRPTTLELKLTSETYAVFGKNAAVEYHLMNTGTKNDTYKVEISDELSLLILPTRAVHIVNAGESVNGSFVFKPSIRSVLYSYTVTVSLVSTSEIIQRIIKRIMVTDIERPTCTILTRSLICNDSTLEITRCDQYHWNAQIDISFSGTELDIIDTNSGSSVKLEHQNISGLRNGPVNVNISGTCCTPISTINAIDLDGYIAQCHLDFSNGQMVRLDNATDSPGAPSNGGESVNIIIIIAIVAAAAVVILAVIGIIVCKRILKYYNYSAQRTGSVQSQSRRPIESSVTFQVGRATDTDNITS